MQNTNSKPLPLSEAAAQRLGYNVVRRHSVDGVSFFREFSTGEVAVLDIESIRPDRGSHCWLKSGHADRYIGELEIEGAMQDRAEQLDFWELSAAYARDLGNEAVALRCEEYRRRNLRDMRESGVKNFEFPRNYRFKLWTSEPFDPRYAGVFRIALKPIDNTVEVIAVNDIDIPDLDEKPVPARDWTYLYFENRQHDDYFRVDEPAIYRFVERVMPLIETILANSQPEAGYGDPDPSPNEVAKKAIAELEDKVAMFEWWLPFDDEANDISEVSEDEE
ncbi:hypothetical protein [Pelagibacterium sediminicola]|uniref:hypothetical protein n=1 Tax=Pelagibacterium sediminicola TaxID=2248761 RepID=UPI0013006F24|nr:hypothetical protein [Pelagibacterium sediminicola]